MLLNIEPVATEEAGPALLDSGTLVRWPAVYAHRLEDERRGAVERHIAGIFHASYGAIILEYLPLLISLEREGAFSAALGLRSATQNRLFCEQYLDTGIEEVVGERFGCGRERRRIMELGNLAATAQADGAMLYLQAAAVIYQAGIRYLTFAANRAVRLSIRRCRFAPLIVASVRADRLAAKARYWGSYYQGNPMVMLADLDLTMRQSRAQPAMAALLPSCRVELEQLTDVVRHLLP